MNYSLRIKRSARNEIERIARSERKRIVDAIDALAHDPFRGTALKGDLRGLRLIRVGDYRVIYEVLDSSLVVLVIRVRHRRDVYRR